MLKELPDFSVAPERQAIRLSSTLSESQALAELRRIAEVPARAAFKIQRDAGELVDRIRLQQQGKGGIDALLQEYSLSSEEGIALMCLAEALLRIPDSKTQDRMIREQINAGDWATHLGHSDSLFVNTMAWGLLLTGTVTHLSDDLARNLLTRTVIRLGEPVIRSVMRQAMQVMGDQFVMGRDMPGAVTRAEKWEEQGYTYSYDMLGEGARTQADADIYFARYLQAIQYLGENSKTGAGISVKLSALHPRYELHQHDRVMSELVPKLLQLAIAAKDLNIGFTIDAEESFRLDISLEVVTTVLKRGDFSGWDGFGIAVQAYQKSGLRVVDWLVSLAKYMRQRLSVRLVKGAYWDSEIKWAQQGGFDGYPVFTRKHATDISYQACARRLLQSRQFIYPQFATHNAYSVAAIRQYELLSGQSGGYEFQRLHGMGEELYDELVETGAQQCRIYAPVGKYEDLLAYLVRRLLENGANTSFVNNIQNREVPIQHLIANPLQQTSNGHVIPLPREIFQPRVNSRGYDLSNLSVIEDLQRELADIAAMKSASGYDVVNPATGDVIGYIEFDDKNAMLQKLARVVAGQESWSSSSFAYRAGKLRDLAGHLEENKARFLELCMIEAGKTLADAMAELREAIDFCRYYADEAEKLHGEPMGTALCISPWNFPLAIFLGQVSAALVVGNTVLAKPAEQTSMIAQHLVNAMYDCGIPQDALQLVLSDGESVGQSLVSDSRVDGVIFTGSDRTAKMISAQLNERNEGEILLIAETGGVNVMIVDSTALVEQVVDDVVASAFESAGQRCSALRVLYLQDDVAEEIVEKLIGRMSEIRVGDPVSLSTDVGPIIDEHALARLHRHVEMLEANDATLLFRCKFDATAGYFFPPSLYALNEATRLEAEAFGPILHVKRFAGDQLESLVTEINASGFGLTCGIHSRIESRCIAMAKLLRVGNIYVNRNMVGAVVGAQPFGGMSRSGTGPKAGGPNYLPRLLGRLGGKVSRERLCPTQATTVEPQVPFLTQWQSMTTTDRVQRVRLLLLDLIEASPELDGKSVLEKFDSVIRWVQVNDTVVQLPSITGESNSLAWIPRGVLSLHIASVTDEIVLLMATGLVTGNGLLVSGNSAVVEDIATGGLAIGFSSALELRSNGIIVSADCGWYQELRGRLLAIHDALVPVLNDWSKPWLFMTEKTVTFNTAASGGNAALLAGNPGP